MLTIITGRSASGKTQRILQEIKEASDSGRSDVLLLVPEQRSHEYERRLCSFCSAKVNLCAEVLSFTRLASRVETECGGAADKVLDKGGRVLLMSLALRSVRPMLKVYSASAEKPDFIARLIESSDELKSSRILPETLTEKAEELGGTLADKLSDIGLICMAYDAKCANVALDPRDRLTRLAEKLPRSSYAKYTVYLDSFTDFTAQELAVIEAFLACGADVKVALKCCRDEREDSSGIFAIQLSAKKSLLNIADRLKTETKLIHLENKPRKCAELQFLDEKLFAEKIMPFEGDCRAIKLHVSENLTSECETAAAEVLALVREGYRFRDIAVVSRGFAAIAPAAESVFRLYGIPVFLSRMADIMQKPVMELIVSALECVSGTWDHDSVFRYLRTDLAGLTQDECDELEEYVLTWNVRGSKWTSGKAWTDSPSGYKKDDTEAASEKLLRINELRARAVTPLLMLREEGKKAENASQQAQALYAFMKNIGLAENLEARAERLAQAGDSQRAEEYRQLWNIIITALEQTAAILNTESMSQSEFASLLRLVLSQYDVGTIPQSLDCVSMGDLSRLSGDVKCLIVLDAEAQKLPAVSEGRGMFSDYELVALEEAGISISGGAKKRIEREMGSIYSAFTAPTDRLFLSYHSGREVTPSFVLDRIKEMFGLSYEPDSDERRTAAEEPCFALASSLSQSAEAVAARACLSSDAENAGRLETVKNAARMLRGSLSKQAAKSLYGERVSLSASKADSFVRCRFGYFMRYGLKAKARRKAEIDPMQTGLFIHHVLEKTTEQVKPLGGFRKADPETVEMLARANMRDYLNEVFGGPDGKDGRFRYLFDRLCESTLQIVNDMSGELRNSLFEPMNMEMDFREKQEEGFTLVGAVDRVDGYMKDGRLYLRVVDYKTGTKSFDISDVWYGLGMQMLIYLFELEKNGEKLYGQSVVPAGVLYAPAKEVIANTARDASDETVAKELSKLLVRSGLLLNDGEILHAMETSSEPRYIPVRFKNGEAVSSSVASLERFGMLSKHIDRTLSEISSAIRNGSITAEPYYENREKGVCDYCEYRAACLFCEDMGEDKKRFLRHIKSEEAWQKIAEEAENNG